VNCSRCQLDLSSLAAVSGNGMTVGYYNADGWVGFCDPGEKYICDACMFKDPRYIKIYGIHS